LTTFFQERKNLQTSPLLLRERDRVRGKGAKVKAKELAIRA
jgi:hypothetical protein